MLQHANLFLPQTFCILLRAVLVVWWRRAILPTPNISMAL